MNNFLYKLVFFSLVSIFSSCCFASSAKIGSILRKFSSSAASKRFVPIYHTVSDGKSHGRISLVKKHELLNHRTLYKKGLVPGIVVFLRIIPEVFFFNPQEDRKLFCSVMYDVDPKIT